MPVRLIPVLDVKSGRAVRAVAGNRDHYQPLRTILHQDSDPLGVARAYRDGLGLRELYLADLDAIAGAPLCLGLYRDITALGLHLWLDAGMRDQASVESLRDSGVGTWVAGLETLRGPTALAELVERVGGESLVFSLDLRGGMPVTAPESGWRTSDPRAIAETAIGLGVRRLILLDLHEVGMGRGVGTLPLVSTLSAEHPGVEFTIGGGAATAADLAAAQNAGAAAVLVGSALHDGRIRAADLANGALGDA